MILLQSIFENARYITQPISLLAVAIIAAMFYFIRKDNNDRKKIESVKESDRATLILKTAERLNVDIYAVAEEKRYDLIKHTLENRHTRFLITARLAVLVFIICCVTYLVAKGMAGNNIPPDNGKDTTADRISPVIVLDSSHSQLSVPIKPDTVISPDTGIRTIKIDGSVFNSITNEPIDNVAVIVNGKKTISKNGVFEVELHSKMMNKVDALRIDYSFISSAYENNPSTETIYMSKQIELHPFKTFLTPKNNE